MNEKFENLMYQAGLTAQGSWDNMDSYDREAIAKFAELIVRECVDICEQQRMKILNNPNDPSWTEHLIEAQTNIRQHFGVK